MKTIQIKIGNDTIGFDNWNQVILYSALQLNNGSNSNRTKILEAIKRFKNNSNNGTLVNNEQLKDFLFND